jgi:hypothetical protein
MNVLRRTVKSVFVGISFVFWLFAGLLVLELREDHVTSDKRANAYAAPIIAQAETRDMELHKATQATSPRPPAEIAAKYPLLEALDNATESECGGLAERPERCASTVTLARAAKRPFGKETRPDRRCASLISANDSYNFGEVREPLIALPDSTERDIQW